MFVHYPFHSLHGQELQVFVSERSPDGTVTVQDAKHKRLKIPLWMVAPEAAECKLSDTPAQSAKHFNGSVTIMLSCR